MSTKQQLSIDNPNHCPINDYQIYSYSSYLETFVTLFRASMGGYDVCYLLYYCKMENIQWKSQISLFFKD